MDEKYTPSQQHDRSTRDASTARIGILLQYGLFAIPSFLLVIFVVGWLKNNSQQIGNELQLATVPESTREPLPQRQSSVEVAPSVDPSNPLEVLAPYADVMWLTLAASLGVLFLTSCAVAIMRVMPEKRYAQATGGAGNFSEPKDVFAKRQHLLRVLESDAGALFEGRIEVRHVMTRSLVTTTPNEPLESACELMDSKNVHHLAVCNDDGLLVGMLSLHYARRSNATTVGKAMLTNPLSVSPDSLLNPTVTQMIGAGVSCVAVVAEGYCVGILTTADVQLTLQCALALLFKATNDESDGEAGSESQAAPGDDAVKLDEVLVPVGPGV